MLCIELGDDLVKSGNDKFSNYFRIKFEHARFEDHEISEGFYDIVLSTQAFHWIPQPVGFEKSAVS
jgi:hypothetical protein